MSIDLQLTSTYIIIIIIYNLYHHSLTCWNMVKLTIVFHTIPEANAVLEGFLKLRQYLHKASRKMLYIDPQLSPLGTAMHGLGDMELF